MSNHVKPSKEELQANIDKSLEDFDNIKEDNKEEDIENNNEEENNEEGENTEEDSKETEKTEETEEDNKKDEIDYEKKFKASSRIAQLEGYKNKEIKKAYKEASEIKDVTDEELKTEYSEWDEMTDTEKKLAKNTFISKKQFNIINGAISKFEEVDAWEEKVNAFVEDPKVLIKYPELDGKEDEFKHFVSQGKRRSMELEDLVLAFNGYRTSVKPPKKKGRMFPSGSAGVKTQTKVKSDKMSVAEGRALMKTDYKKYVRFLKENKIAYE